MLVYIFFSLIIVSVSAKPEDGDESPTLPTGRCLPTSVVRGPCHKCVCQEDGIFQCHHEDCEPEQEPITLKDQKECTANVLHRDGILWCSCTKHSRWKSENCRQTFRHVRGKTTLRNQFLNLNDSCDSGAYYAIDCNVCLCKNNTFSPSSCTNRTCTKGHKADHCKLGQLLKTDNQLCACSEIGYFVDKLCVTVSRNKTSKLTLEDLKILTHEDKFSKLRQNTCVPNTIIQRDCNKCKCTETGTLICTSKLCLPPKEDNVTDLSFLRFNSKLQNSKLPVLKSLSDECVPGEKYRFKCNTCVCTKKGKPTCTNMVCLEDYINNEKVEDLMHDGTSIKSNGSIQTKSESDNCTVGMTYKVGCNNCICSKKSRLVCTKVACINTEDQIKLKSMQQKFYDKKAQEKASHSGNKKHKLRSSSDLPILVKNKCEPGQIYKKSIKSCQRCFCTNKHVPMCTNKDCKDMRGPIVVPSDVYPRIPYKRFINLPTRPHLAAKCTRGKVYKIECNICLCLANGNMLCDTRLCLSISEVNKYAAIKYSGTPCKKGDTGPAGGTEPAAGCIKCECIKELFDCEPIAQCTPFRFRKSLHGDISIAKPKPFLEEEGACEPEMVYKKGCNKCYCQQDGSLRCTKKGCLNYQLVQKLNKQRVKLIQNGL